MIPSGLPPFSIPGAAGAIFKVKLGGGIDGNNLCVRSRVRGWHVLGFNPLLDIVRESQSDPSGNEGGFNND